MAVFKQTNNEVKLDNNNVELTAPQMTEAKAKWRNIVNVLKDNNCIPNNDILDLLRNVVKSSVLKEAELYKL